MISKDEVSSMPEETTQLISPGDLMKIVGVVLLVYFSIRVSINRKDRD